MRIPANLTFFIDDCHVSAYISSQGKSSIFVSDRKEKRDLNNREALTILLLKELSKDVRDWSAKPEFANYEINTCSVVMSPSWYVTQTSSVVKDSPKPIIFTEDMILGPTSDDLTKNSDVYSSLKDLLLIEKEISHVALNDYPVSSISKQRALSVKALVYCCYMSKHFNTLILDALKSVNHRASQISFHSLAKVTSNNTRKILGDLFFLKNKNLVIINFCSYVTEVLLLQNETDLNIISLPIGHKETIHTISENTGADHSVTESLLDLFINNKLKQESRDTVIKLIQKLGGDWANLVMQGINQLPKSPNSSTKLFIYGVDSQQAEIAKIFSSRLPFSSNENTPVILLKEIML